MELHLGIQLSTLIKEEKMGGYYQNLVTDALAFTEEKYTILR